MRSLSGFGSGSGIGAGGGGTSGPKRYDCIAASSSLKVSSHMNACARAGCASAKAAATTIPNVNCFMILGIKRDSSYLMFSMVEPIDANFAITPIPSIVSDELTWLLDCKITVQRQPLET